MPENLNWTAPQLGSLNQVGPRGIAFHVTADRVEMLVFLNRERPERRKRDWSNTGHKT